MMSTAKPLHRKSIQYGSLQIDDSDSQQPLLSPSLCSISIICFVVFIADTARGIFFPTLWLFVLSLGGTKGDQGICVAAFSLGRIISSPIFGYWSQTSHFRVVLLTCNVVILVGCFCYALSNSIFFLIISQLLLGFGAGSLGVTRSYIAENSTPAQRTVYLANLTAFQYAGFTVTPVVGSMLASVGYQFRGSNILGFQINEFSVPAIGYAIMTLICCILLLLFFEERGRAFHVNLLEQSPPQSESIWTRTWTSSEKAILIGCLLNIATKGTIGVFETLGSGFVMSHFHWSSVWTGYTFALAGGAGVLSLLLFPLYTKFLTDFELVFFGMVLMSISCFLMLGIFSHHQTPIEFIPALILMYTLGYPIGHTALLGMFSKIVKSGPQGGLLGWFGSAGSLARVLFPLLAGFLAQHFGSDQWIFSIFGIFIVFSIFLLFQTKMLFLDS